MQLNLAAQSRDFTNADRYGMSQALGLSSGFGSKDHGVRLQGAVDRATCDHQACTLHLGVPTHDFRDLRVVNEHPAHLRRLVGPAHPAFDAQVRAPARAGPRKDRRKISGAEPDQRVVRIERSRPTHRPRHRRRDPRCLAERFAITLSSTIIPSRASVSYAIKPSSAVT